MADIFEKEIPDHAGFRCNQNGDIIGKRGKVMKGHVDRCGYHEVLLSENGKVKNCLVHRLVLATFCPIENMEKYDVNHKNGNKLDNRLENLEWCTRSENIKHSYKNQLQKKITNPHGTYRVLDEEDMEYIKMLHKQRFTDAAIAEHLGCSRSLVSKKIREMGIR